MPGLGECPAQDRFCRAGHASFTLALLQSAHPQVKSTASGLPRAVGGNVIVRRRSKQFGAALYLRHHIAPEGKEKETAGAVPRYSYLTRPAFRFFGGVLSTPYFARLHRKKG